MKKLFVYIIIFFTSVNLCAQTVERVQKGTVRSQSYTGRTSSPIEGAIIRRKDGVTPAISDSIGNFGLSMEKIDSKDDVYYISSVEVGDKRKKYELFSPLPDDAQQYKPNSKLIIIMHSETEWNAYMRERIAKTDIYYSKLYADSLAVLNDKLEKTLITEQEYDRVSNELFELRQNGPKLMEAYLRNVEANTDYESLDSTKQKIRNAVYENNLDYAKQLLSEFGSFEENFDEYIQLEESENAIREIRRRKAEDLLFSQNERVEIALKEGDFDTALQAMRNRLKVSPDNVSYLCELGQFEEITFNLYEEAKSNYSRALEQAKRQNLSEREVAICNNHLGDVYYNLSEFTLAEEHYTQARLLLEPQKEVPQGLYDSYLGLGNVYFSKTKFDEALRCYKKCANPIVASINKKAFWQGRIGIGQVKFAKGDYHGARANFEEILKEIVAMKDVDVVTLSLAYGCIVDCMTSVGQCQEAIDSCQAAIKLIEKHSSSKNRYLADFLIDMGDVYVGIGKIEEGEQCMNKAKDIYMNVLGENHPNYAMACVMFANYYIIVGDLQKSEEMSSKALGLLCNKFGKNHFTTVAAHYSKCKLYQTYAEYDKAQAELDTIRIIYKSLGLLNDYNRIQLNTDEAALQMEQGMYPKGIKIFQEAVDCVTRTLGKESVQLIGLYNQMALVYFAQLKHDKAKYYLEKAQLLANKIYGDDSPTAIMQQIGMGKYYANRGDYHRAYKLYSKIEKVTIEVFGADNHQLYGIYEMLGDYHLGQYQFDKAKYYYDKIYEIVKATYGENHNFLAAPITKIGAYYKQIGDFHKELEKERQAYDILSKHFGVGHKATLESQLGICSAYIELGQYDQAESVLIELSKAVEKNFGKDNLMYSNVLQIKAILHKCKGEYNSSINCVEEAIRITESVFGKHHSSTMNHYKQLSEIYSEMCNIQKTIEYNDLAIAIATKFYGKDNIGVMPFLLEKGLIYAGLNKISEAHKVYDKVKKTYISHFGDSCKQPNPALIPEAQLLSQEGYGEQALELLKNVEKQMISIYGEYSTHLCNVYNSLADVYQLNMQYQKAREYYQKSLDVIENAFGESNVNCIHSLVGLGNVCLSEDVTGQQIAEASRLFRKASFISSSVYGSNHVNTTTCDALLGQISLRQGNLQDAYKKFQKLRTSVMQTYGDKTTAHERIADAYMNMGYYYMAKAKEASFLQDSVNTRDYTLRAMDEFEKARNNIETVYGSSYAGIAKSLNAIAEAYLVLQRPDSAIVAYKKAAKLTIGQFGGQSPLVAQAYATLGATYKYESEQICLGDNDKLNDAKECFLKAITIRENSKGSSKEILMASTIDWRMALSDVYMKLNDYNNAFRTVDKVIRELEDLQLDNKFGLFNSYYMKASMIVQSERDSKEALLLLLKAKNLFPLLSFPNNSMKEMQQFQLMFAFGNVYEKLEMLDEAIESYEDAYSKLKLFPNNPQVESMNHAIRDKIQELKSK